MTDSENKRSVSIVIPVFNQLHYTRQCLDSLHKTGVQDREIIVVNNGSTDGTKEYLASLPGLTVISNGQNQGVAFAWNQGVGADNSEWVVVLNNDVLLGEGWLDAMIEVATKRNWRVISPAICHGDLDYDFQPYAREFVKEMANVVRHGVAAGPCFMVHRDVFRRVGKFDENFRVGLCEDADFFLRTLSAGFSMGTTGRAYLHHFGARTMKEVRAVSDDFVKEHKSYFRRKWGMNWVKRRWRQLRIRTVAAWWSATELASHGRTLIESRIQGKRRFS